MSRVSQTRRRHAKRRTDERQFRRAGYAAGVDVTFTGTGDGVLSGMDAASDAPAETWTVTFSDATNFGVTGSVSGAQTAGVAGTPYVSDGGEVSFLISVGGTPFVATDEFVFDVEVIVGVQPELQSNRAAKWFRDQLQRVIGVDSMNALFGRTQDPGLVKSNAATSEDVEAASTASDIGLS